MKLKSFSIRNFRRLENVSIDIDDKDSVFVGSNNSGKTSATAVFRCFLAGRDFRIHDFSVSTINVIDRFPENTTTITLPSLSLDLWFSINPKTLEFGRAFSLLHELSDSLSEVGVRLTYGVIDSKALLSDYAAAYPAQSGKRAKTLSQFLGLDGNLRRYFGITYASLERVFDKITPTPLAKDEGKKLLQGLIRVDFIDAQRNIDDDDSSRSNRLSAAFAAFYQKNLEQADVAAEAHKVIDDNNSSLSDHYKKQFDPLFALIQGLGVPSINDRSLKIISSLSPETALRGNTELLYVDEAIQHELPELYNGLGFKNLIYMAIQAKHYHSQWLKTAENRALCHLIFIEEPEVHLHAQVQQCFISNIWAVLEQSAKQHNEQSQISQLVVTTHSSHILDAVDFDKVRYFRKCAGAALGARSAILNATEVRSLKNFSPTSEKDKEEKAREKVAVEGEQKNMEEENASTTSVIKDDSSEVALAFLKRYLRLTHCDMFFADGVILVEGAAEKLLLPSMIEKTAPGLKSTYITILEIGGAYAHRFEQLLTFLSIPYLVITDLDSVTPKGRATVCRADIPDARTSNAALKNIFGISTVKELMELSDIQQGRDNPNRYVTFQRDVEIVEGAKTCALRPRTLEEAIVYENLPLFRSGALSIGEPIPEAIDDVYTCVYETIRSAEFKKTDFALSLLDDTAKWTTPRYIADGLDWLHRRLCAAPPTEHVHSEEAA